MKGFQSCLDSEKYKAEIQTDANEAASLQISGTPTFVLAKSAKDKLDGVRIVGAQPFAMFQTAIDALLKYQLVPPSSVSESSREMGSFFAAAARFCSNTYLYRWFGYMEGKRGGAQQSCAKWCFPEQTKRLPKQWQPLNSHVHASLICGLVWV
jgi:hypothetical protein